MTEFWGHARDAIPEGYRSMLSKAALASTNAMYNVRLCSSSGSYCRDESSSVYINNDNTPYQMYGDDNFARLNNYPTADYIKGVAFVCGSHAPVALTACVASEARRLFTAATQQLNGKVARCRGATIHCMGIAGPNAYWLACATFRRGASQAGC